MVMLTQENKLEVYGLPSPSPLLSRTVHHDATPHPTVPPLHAHSETRNPKANLSHAQ
jgi:hypothetical protein